MEKLDDMRDNELVMLAKVGDLEAFATLFLHYKEEVYNCLIRIVKNNEVAEDLFQDTFLKVWNNVQNLREPPRFRVWLFEIAKNLAVDHMRKNLLQKISSLEEHIGTLYDPNDPAENVIERESILYVLKRMKLADQAMLILHAQGYSQAEIAHKLGFKESAVSVSMLQARKQARQLYRHLADNIDEVRTDIDEEKEHVYGLLQRIRQEAKECAMELGLPEQAGYDVLAVIHGQALMGEREAFPTETSFPPSADVTKGQDQ